MRAGRDGCGRTRRAVLGCRAPVDHESGARRHIESGAATMRFYDQQRFDSDAVRRVRAAALLADRWRHTVMDCEHLLWDDLEQPNGLLRPLLESREGSDARIAALREGLERRLEERERHEPGVRGSICWPPVISPA